MNGVSVENMFDIKQLPDTGYLRLSHILGSKNNPAIIPVSRSAWYAGIKTGRFPKPVKLGPRTAAWRVEDIREYIERVNEAQEKLDSSLPIFDMQYEIQVLGNMNLIVENMEKCLPGSESLRFQWLEMVEQVKRLREKQSRVVSGTTYSK